MQEPAVQRVCVCVFACVSSLHQTTADYCLFVCLFVMSGFLVSGKHLHTDVIHGLAYSLIVSPAASSATDVPCRKWVGRALVKVAVWILVR